MQLSGELVELGNIQVGFGPNRDRVGHERHAAKIAEQPDHRVDVVRVVAALREAAACDAQVGIRPLEFGARLPIAQRYRDRVDKALVVGGALRLGVRREVIDSVFLPLGPQAFAAHVGTHCRQDVGATDAERGQQRYGDQERADDEPVKARA